MLVVNYKLYYAPKNTLRYKWFNFHEHSFLSLVVKYTGFLGKTV